MPPRKGLQTGEPLSPPPYLDTRTPALTLLGQVVVLLAFPLACARLALLFAVMGAYCLALVPLNRATADPDAPNFRAYEFVTRLSFAAGRLALAAVGFRVRVHGAEHVAAAYAANTATVVVSNHVSYFDVFALGAAIGPYFPVTRAGACARVRRHTSQQAALRLSTPPPAGCCSAGALTAPHLSAADIATLPIFGALLRMWGFTGVDRSRGAEGITARLAARARRTGAWAKHPPVLVFPEGTCSTGDALLRFKSGAFVAGVPVLPVALRYTAGDLCAGWVWRDHGASASPLSRLPTDVVHLARLLLARNKAVDVYVLPPHVPDAAQCADATSFAEAVRREMGAVLGVPLDDRGVDDARAYYASRIDGYSKSK